MHEPKVDARQGLLDEQLELIPHRREGDAGHVGQAAAGEQGEDTALLSKMIERSRRRRRGEGATPAVGHNGGLEGGEVSIAVGVVVNEGFEAVDPANSRARRSLVQASRALRCMG